MPVPPANQDDFGKTALLFKIKNNGQRQKCSGIKDLQKYVNNIFYTYRGYQDIDFIKKMFLKNVAKLCKKKIMNKHYLQKYIVVSHYLGYSKTLMDHYLTKNFNKL